MADQTSSSIEIAAPPQAVMDVIADFAHYPEWVDSMSRATVLSEADGRAEQVEMVLSHPLIKDTYTLAYRWAPDAVSWHLVQGSVLKAMDGSYTLSKRPAPGGTDATLVVYALSVDANLPMIGLLRRKAEKTIIDGALKGLKRRVEG